MSPCLPSRPTAECERCERFRPQLAAVQARWRRALQIDGSVVTKPGKPCPMLLAPALS